MRRMTIASAVFTLVATASAFAQITPPTPPASHQQSSASPQQQQQTPPPAKPPATQQQTPPVTGQQATPPAAKPVAAQPAPFPADSKIGFIDIQTIVSSSKLGRAGSAKMKVLTDKQSADMSEKSKAIQALQQQIQQQAGVLSPAALQQKQADLDKLQREAQFAQQDWQAQIDNLNKQLLDDFQQKALPIVEEIRNERGLWAIFNIPDSGVAAVHPGLDLSSEVVKRLDAKYPGGGD
jgi:outer membrane protein